MAPYTIVSAPTLEKGPVYRFTEKAPYHITVRRTDVRNGYGYCLAELLDAPLESDLLEGIVDELNAKGIEFRITYDADREWLRTCTESVTDDGVPVYRYPESSFNPYYYRFTERKTGKHIAVFINAPSWCIPMYKLFRDLVERNVAFDWYQEVTLGDESVVAGYIRDIGYSRIRQRKNGLWSDPRHEIEDAFPISFD